MSYENYYINAHSLHRGDCAIQLHSWPEKFIGTNMFALDVRVDAPSLPTVARNPDTNGQQGPRSPCANCFYIENT